MSCSSLRCSLAMAIVFAMMALITCCGGDVVTATKSICIPITVNGKSVDPSTIPVSTLTGMSNRGAGSFTVQVSLCVGAPVSTSCATAGVGASSPTATAYVAITNRTGGCLASFDKALQRPTATKAGFKVSYSSTVETKDMVDITVRCDPSPTANNKSLISKSKRFATTFPNKFGGTTYHLIVYSSVACGGGSAPPSPPPSPPSGGGNKCKAIKVRDAGMVYPNSWTTAFLTLDVGVAGQWSWLFQLCAPTPTPPTWADRCSPNGYAVAYNGEVCRNVTFDKMTSFGLNENNNILTITYGSTINPNDVAKAVITCADTPYLSSPSGAFFVTNNTNNNGRTFSFYLGIQDMCPSTPTPPPGSGSYGPMPSGSGSGSSGLPPSNSNGGSSNLPPPVPSHGGGGSASSYSYGSSSSSNFHPDSSMSSGWSPASGDTLPPPGPHGGSASGGSGWSPAGSSTYSGSGGSTNPYSGSGQSPSGGGSSGGGFPPAAKFKRMMAALKRKTEMK